MNKYIFLTENNNEGPTKYFAIPEDKIKILKVCDCYDNYGQKISHYDAGDYHLDNSASDATHDCIKAISDKFIIPFDDIHIVESDDEFIIEPGDGEEYGFNEDEVNSFIAEWRRENESLNKVEGFTYWDGHNHKTVITEYIDGPDYATHSIVSDNTLTTELNKAIEEMDFADESFGTKTYEGNGYVITESFFAGDWETYEIIKADEVEIED